MDSYFPQFKIDCSIEPHSLEHVQKSIANHSKKKKKKKKEKKEKEKKRNMQKSSEPWFKKQKNTNSSHASSLQDFQHQGSFAMHRDWIVSVYSSDLSLLRSCKHVLRDFCNFEKRTIVSVDHIQGSKLPPFLLMGRDAFFDLLSMEKAGQGALFRTIVKSLSG